MPAYGMQSLLTKLAEVIAEQNLPALLIGGHAVTALSYPRATYDIDLLIPASSIDNWHQALAGLGYSRYAKSENFSQYEPNLSLPLPPIDLMTANDSIFQTLFLDRNQLPIIPTPSAKALIALKLHAISQPSRTEIEKDWSDIIALTQANQLSLDDPEFAAIVRKHGGEIAIKRIQDSVASGN